MRATAAVAALLSAASLVAAQTVQKIQVGAEAATPGGIFQFIPANITAANGTIVQFTWAGSPGNHTVTQSSADTPCQPLDGGFDSGFLFIPPNTTTGFPTWNLTITNDQEPIYFYCAQLQPSPHCFAGMVGSINAPATGNGSWDAVVSLAGSATATLPGQPTPNGPLANGVWASATAPPGPVGTAANGIQGFDLPVSSAASAASGASGASSTGGAASTGGSGSGSGAAPAPTSGGSSGALANAVNGAALVMSAVLGALLL